MTTYTKECEEIARTAIKKMTNASSVIIIKTIENRNTGWVSFVFKTSTGKIFNYVHRNSWFETFGKEFREGVEEKGESIPFEIFKETCELKVDYYMFSHEEKISDINHLLFYLISYLDLENVAKVKHNGYSNEDELKIGEKDLLMIYKTREENW